MTRNGQPKAAPPRAQASDDGERARPQLCLGQFVPHRLSVLSNTVSRAISREYARRFGLSIPEWRVIAVLRDFPGISSGELADESGMDNVAVSRAVNHLVRAGLVTRHACPADRRRRVLDLTPQGESVYDEITPLALGYERSLLETLEPEERGQLDALLDKLLSRARRLG